MFVDRKKHRVVATICLVGLGAPGAALAQLPKTDAARGPHKERVIKSVVERSDGLAGAFHDGNGVETPALDVVALMAEDDAQTTLGPLRTGIVQDIEPKIGRQGQWTALDDGAWLWTISFAPTGAQAVRVRIRPWNPPAGAELVVYDAHDPDYAVGPFTSTLKMRYGKFWTPTLYTDEVRLEYYLPPGIDHLDPEAGITVDGVLNQYRGAPVDGRAGGGLLPCHLDVSCYPDWDIEAAGVGRVLIVTDTSSGLCSGAMMNRAGEDLTPLFMTARHCGITDEIVEDVEILWHYETDECDGAAPDPDDFEVTMGSAVLVQDAQTDYTLLGLRAGVPGGVWYLGWDPNHWDDDSAATGIHHPKGSFKRITFGTKTNDNVASCVGSGSNWKLVWPDGNGEIQPGSSGSPIFDAAHRIRGTASCANWGCNQSNMTTYGRFDVVYSKMAPFLDPVDPIYVRGSFGGTELGTVSNPFDAVIEGAFAVRRGSNVYVESGSYGEQITIDKAMTLHARNGTVTIGN